MQHFKAWVWVAAAVTFSLSTALGAVHYVKQDAVGANDGSSWEDAFVNLRDALDQARSRDDVFVAAGTYRVESEPLESTEWTGVKIYGGFAGTETEGGQRDWQANPTIISGDGGVVGDDSDNAETLVSAGRELTLDGLIFEKSRVAAITSSSDQLRVANCVFRWNASKVISGRLRSCSNCIFVGNTGSYIFEVWGGLFYQCTFASNPDGVFGELIGNNFLPSLSIYNSVFVDNGGAEGPIWFRQGNRYRFFNTVFGQAFDPEFSGDVRSDNGVVADAMVLRLPSSTKLPENSIS